MDKTHKKWIRRFVSVEERESGEIAPTLGLDTDLNDAVLVKNPVIFAIKSEIKSPYRYF
jgi:hypothetical protein